MTTRTATEIKDILEARNDYPFKIRFSTTVPKFPIYPYCVVRKQPPLSRDKDVTDVTERNGFEIQYYVRYTRRQETEEVDQTTVENIMLDALEKEYGADTIFLQTKQWNRTPIPRLYGSQSLLRIIINEKESTTGEGVLGAEMTLTVEDIPVIQILNISSIEGPSVDKHFDDDHLSHVDPYGFDQGDFTIEYESTPELENQLSVYRRAGNEVDVIIRKKGQAKSYKMIIGATSKRGQYDKVERATTKFLVESLTNSVRAGQMGVDAILV